MTVNRMRFLQVGAVAAAFWAASHNNDLNFGGSVTVVSPTK